MLAVGQISQELPVLCNQPLWACLLRPPLVTSQPLWLGVQARLCPGFLRAEGKPQSDWSRRLTRGRIHVQAPHLLAALTSSGPWKPWHLRHRQQRGQKLWCFESLTPGKPWTLF